MTNVEELRQEVDRLWNCYNAMTLPFMELSASINRASGAINVTENLSPVVYLKSAEKKLAEIEKVIQNYRQNKPQAYQVEPSNGSKELVIGDCLS